MPLKDDHRTQRKQRIGRVTRTLKGEGEKACFEAEIRHETPKCHVRSGFSHFSISEKEKYVWDIWVKLPIRVKRHSKQFELFAELIQEAFEHAFSQKKERKN